GFSVCDDPNGNARAPVSRFAAVISRAAGRRAGSIRVDWIFTGGPTMSSAADLTSVIRQLRHQPDAPADPELLDRYATGRDQAAFALLVGRYGALVLGVARRQLADRHRA